MCLAPDLGLGGVIEGDDASDKVREVLVALGTGGGERTQDLEGHGAGWGLVAAGDLAGDDGGSQLAFGEVVGGVDSGMAQEGKQVVALFEQSLPDRFFWARDAKRAATR